MRRSGVLLAALALLALAPAAQAQWRTEAVPSAGVVGPLRLQFDQGGQGLLSWEGFDQRRSPQKFTALDVRAPGGGWRRAADPSGITWGGAQIHLYSRTRAILISRQTSGLGRFNRARFRLVYAYGRSDGAFGALHTIAESAEQFTSAANRAGDVLVAWTDRAGAAHVAERRAGHPFGRPRSLAMGGVTTAAMNARGDRVIAWWGRSGVYARIRRAGGSWGSALLAARVSRVENGPLRAAIAPGGRVLIAWATSDVREGLPITVGAGFALRDTRGGWRAFRLERSSGPQGSFPVGTPAIPLVDSAGRDYVTWTGLSGGQRVVRIAQVTAAGPRPATLLSGAVTGGAVDDAAAGPRGSLAVAWSVPGQTSTDTYASLRRGSGAFAPPERLTPPGTRGLGSSLVAFQPITGEAVVTWGAAGADGRGTLEASTSPPG